MIMVLLQGSRGLFCSDNERIYFPDRSWSDARPCLIKDFNIIKDKETYAFIKAQPLSTEPITIMDLDFYLDDYNIRKVVLDTSEFLLGTVSSCSMNMGFTLWYKINGVVYKETLKSIPELVHLYLSGEEAKCDMLKYYSATCKLDTEERYNTLIIRSLTKLSTVFKTELHIINNCFLRVTKSFSHGDYKDEEFYCLSKDNTLISLGRSLSDNLKTKIKSIKEVDIQSVNRLIREIGLASAVRGHSVSFSDKICRVDIKKDTINISVYAFKVDNFDYSYYNSEESALDRKIVQASLEAYDKIIKSIGRGLTSKSALPILQSLSLRNNLI